jgi:ankyrin repeat protein
MPQPWLRSVVPFTLVALLLPTLRQPPVGPSPSIKDRLLIDAIKRQDPEAVELLLHAGASPNARDNPLLDSGNALPLDGMLEAQPVTNDTSTALAIAVSELPYNVSDVGPTGPMYPKYRLLSLEQLQRNLRTHPNRYPDLKAYIANVRICDDLIGAGASVDRARISDDLKRLNVLMPWRIGFSAKIVTALGMAIYRENSHVVHMLLTHGARLDAGETEGIAGPAIGACRAEDVMALLRQGATVSPGYFGSPLILALYSGRWRLSRTLLETYGSLNARSSLIGTPLHYVNWLLKRDLASPEERNLLVQLRHEMVAMGGRDQPGDRSSVIYQGREVYFEPDSCLEGFYRLGREAQPDTID